MSKTERQADIGFDAEDPRCNDGGPACEGCLMVGWCLGDYPLAETANAERERQCCGSLVTGPHKMGCDYKMR